MTEQKLVMVVDDEEDVRRYLGAILEDAGFEVRTAADGDEAARAAGEEEARAAAAEAAARARAAAKEAKARARARAAPRAAPKLWLSRTATRASSLPEARRTSL